MITLFAIIAAISTMPQLTAYHRQWDGHANGLYWKSDVYAAIPHRQLDDDSVQYCDTIYRTGTAINDKSPARAIVCATPVMGGSSLRFAIAGEFGQFSGGRWPCRFPIADLPLLENTGLGHELFNLKYNPKREYTGGEYSPFVVHSYDLFFPKHRATEFPEQFLRKRLHGSVKSFSVYEFTHLVDLELIFASLATFDILPIDGNSLRFFHAIDGRLDISTEPIKSDVSNEFLVLGKKPAPIPERDLKSGKLPASFKGRFHAYVVGDLHYLLTAGGKLYKCAAKGEDGLEITEVWSDPARPLIGVVDCPDTRQAFAFGWGSKPGSTGRYWIEFGDKPVPTAYILKAKLKNDREDAFREVNDCVNALQAMKAIKPAPKPEKVQKVKKE